MENDKQQISFEIDKAMYQEYKKRLKKNGMKFSARVRVHIEKDLKNLQNAPL